MQGPRIAALAIAALLACWVTSRSSSHASDAGADAAPVARPDAGLVHARPDAGLVHAIPDAGLVHAIPDAGHAALDAGATAAAPTDAAVQNATKSRPRRWDAGIADAAVDAPVDAGVEDALDAAVEVDAYVPADASVDAPLTEAEAAVVAEEQAVDAPITEAVPEGPPASAESTVFALKIVFGLALLLALAYLGGNRRVRRLGERIGIGGVILAGFPFVALGVIASLPEVGVLGEDVLPKLRPLLQFGLGWIGLIVGAQLDIRVLDRVPRGSAYLMLIEALAPFATTALLCGAVMIGVFGLSLQDPAAWRDIILLGAAAAMTAPRKFRGLTNRTWYEGRSADVLLGQLDEIVGVVGLLFIMAYFRDDASSPWHLPGTAWLLVSVGLGVVIGVLIFATIRLPRTNAEFLAIVLGAVAFASGLASVLRLSPLVVCFLVGVLITNFPNEQRTNVFKILGHLERPIHLLFLMVAGAIWSVADWRGWALVPLFVAARVAGKWLGIVVSHATLRTVLPAEFTEHRRLIIPMSTMSIALVVSIERFRDLGLAWVVTAVIGGSIITELLVSFRGDGAPEASTAPAREPIDELDERDDGDVPPGDAT